MEKQRLPKEVVEQNKGKMFTTFLLIAPSMGLAGLSVWTGTIGTSLLTLAIFIYQATMLKNYVDKQTAY